MAILPLTADDVPLGALIFTYDHDRTFEAPDRAFKVILARQCALALLRLRLQMEERAQREAAERAAEAEKAARVDAELLYELSATVTALDDLDAIYEHALDAVLRGSRSTRAAILVFDPDGVMRFKAWRGLSDTYRAAVEGHSPWKADEANPVPVAVEDTERDPAWVSYRDVFRAEGIRALAFVPLVYQRKLIGKLMLYRDEPRAFTARELQLTSTVAIDVAQAIERKRAERELARAYRVERDAHLEAEEATRAREEILSVVSHDLRNPLGTILISASTLLSYDGVDRAGRVRTIAERIHRQAERMARLIEDLVDFAGIQAGRLAIERGTYAPAEILAEARDLFGPIAQERGLVLEAAVPSGLPPIECDSERVVQILSNLVSNALKVTPRGGTIAIGAEPREREIVFYVRDSGPGIDPEDLPNLFERFWRSKKASYKGAGLGLSIARGIVDAHGGRIWAESELGAGSTFYFSLQRGEKIRN
jgi:signal transduction histidine kinase